MKKYISLLIILLSFTYVSAGLCKGSDNYYHECGSNINYNEKYYPSYSFNVPTTYVTYSNQYGVDDGYYTRGRSFSKNEILHNINGKFYKKSFSDDKNYIINNYYPYESYEYTTTVSTTLLNSPRVHFVKFNEMKTERQLSVPESYLYRWTVRYFY
jgi:hypothetical protein